MSGSGLGVRVRVRVGVGASVGVRVGIRARVGMRARVGIRATVMVTMAPILSHRWAQHHLDMDCLVHRIWLSGARTRALLLIHLMKAMVS